MAKTNLEALYFQSFRLSPRKGDQRKYEIVRAAIRCIARVGMAGLSFESIGRELGIRRSHVAYHFNNLTEILVAAIELTAATAQSITIEELKALRGSSAGSKTKRLDAITRGAFRWAREHPEQVRVHILLFHLATYDSMFRELDSRIRCTGLERLTEVFSSGGVATPKARRQAQDLQALLTGQLIAAALN